MRIVYKRMFLIFLFIAIFAFTAKANNINSTVKAYIEDENVVVNNETRLIVTVRSDKDVILPIFKTIPFINIEFSGASNPSPIFIDGSVAWERYYVYSLIAEKPGIFEIPSAIVKVGGENLKTEPFTVKVTDEKEEDDGKVVPVFVTASIEPVEAYINQEIIYTLKFYRRVNVENETLDSPVFEGFVVESIEPELDYKEKVGKTDYYVHEKKLALFPLKTGNFVISPSKIICDVPVNDKTFGDVSDISPFYKTENLERRTFSSDIVSVKVVKLPEETMPPNFKNLVGDYSVKVEVSKPTVKRGETTSVIITVSGKGNINDIGEPDFPKIRDCKIYDEFPVVKLYKDGNVFSGEKIFKKIIFPLKTGKVKIPPASIVFLNPSKKRYETLRSKSFNISVVESAEKVSDEGVKDKKVVFKQSVKQLSEDILPVKLSLESLKTSPSLPETNIIWGLLSVPPLFFLILFYLSFRIKKDEKESEKYRRANAMKNLSANLKKIKYKIRQRMVRHYLRCF